EIDAGSNDDLEVVEITNPQAGRCAGFLANEPVTVVLQNNTCRPLYNIPVSIVMTGSGSGTLTEIIPGPVPRFGRYSYTSTGTLNLSAGGTFDITATISATPFVRDTFAANNSATLSLNSLPVVTFPYIANFDGDNQNWSSGSTSSNGSRIFRRSTLPYLNG